MKRNFCIIFAAAALVMSAVACNTVDGPDQKKDSASMVISLSSSPSTKAVDVPQFPEEKVIKDAQVYIFTVPKDQQYLSDFSKYELYKYLELTRSANRDTLLHVEDNVNVSDKYVVAAFVNGLATNYKHPSFQNLAQLRAQVVDLNASNPGSDFSGQFAMYGESSVITVTTGEPAVASIVAQRFVSRIRLLSVQNKLPAGYGNLTIDRVFVINGYSSWNMAGSLDSNNKPLTSGQFNWAGREENHSNDAGYFIDAASDCRLGDYSYGNQTFKSYSNVSIDNFWQKQNAGESTASSIYHFDSNALSRGECFYVFPNAKDYDAQTPDSQGYSASFDGKMPLAQTACTRLVVHAIIENNGAPVGYYYPVTIPGDYRAAVKHLQRNMSYDVNLIISGFGSDDPNREPVKGSIQTEISVKPWDGAFTYNPEI